MAAVAGFGPRSLVGLSVRPLSDIATGKHEGPDWLIEGILPQGAFLIVGRPKVGKSWFLLQLGMVLSGGGKIFDREALGHFRTVYIAAEDDPGRIASRLQKYRIADPPSNLGFICRDDLKKYAAEFAEHYSLAEFIDVFLHDNPDVKALIIDTESTVRAEWDGGSIKRDVSVTRNDYAEVREFDEIAHRRRVWIGLVNHTAKRRNGHWLDIHELINRTNTALAGASGSIVIADPPHQDPLAERGDNCKILGIRGRDITNDQLLTVRQDEFAIFQSLGDYQAHRQTESELEMLEALEELCAQSEDPERWVTSKQLGEWVERRSGAVKKIMSRMLAKADRQRWKDWRVESRQKKGYRLVSIVT